MKTLSRSLFALAIAALAAAPVFAQCGLLVVNPTTGKLDCTGLGVGFANNITPFNTAYGFNALVSPSLTGLQNAAFGYNSLNADTTGTDNAAFGEAALPVLTSGSNNIAIGQAAMTLATTASNNTAVGVAALYSVTGGGGSSNTGIGFNALLYNTAGQNSAVGYGGLVSNTSGGFNTALGYNAGYGPSATNANTTGSYNSFLGWEAAPGSTVQQTYMTVIGAGATGTCSSCVVLGRPADMVVVPNGYKITPLYSVAGTALPACSATTLLEHLGVTDATSITPGTTYAGSSTYTVTVECVSNSTGPTYTWIID